jgi:acetyl esterase/lipase
MPMKVLVATVLLLAMSTAGRGAPPADKAPTRLCEVKTTRELVYYEVRGDPDRERHRLDVYSPQGKTDCPVLVFVHGGAWTIGRKDDYFGILGYGTIARCLARRGLVVVLPNYRLSPGVRHPEHVKDVARAFAWTCRNAGKYGGDPARIIACGHSAGGHLVSLLATDETYLKAEGRTRKDIKGVIGISGVYCIKDLEWDLTAAAPGGWASARTKVSPFAEVFGTDPKALEQASPIAHVGPGLPPFLLINAGLDYWPLPRMAKKFAAALKDNGCAVETQEIPWRTHETVVFDILNRTAEEETVEAVVRFVERTVCKAPARQEGPAGRAGR